VSGPENQTTSISGDVDIDFLHEIGKNASSVPLSKTLARVAVFVSNVMRCDSCFVYLLDGRDLVMRASKNPHKDALDRLKIQVGQGITGWVAEHKQTAAIAQMAYKDARFKTFNELPEDRYEAFLSVPLLCRDKVIGVINVQHRQREPNACSQVRPLARRQLRVRDWRSSHLAASEPGCAFP